MVSQCAASRAALPPTLLTVPATRSHNATEREGESLALEAFELASAELLAARALQRRVDAKFVVPRSTLPELLALLAPHFHIVTSNGSRRATYETLYFDTADFSFFHAHRRGRRPRHKVRVRHYVERDVCYLETKTKDAHGVTTKHRFPRPSRAFDIAPADVEAIEGAIGATEPLRPVLDLVFPRVTLVGTAYNERLTIDLGISARAAGTEMAVPDASIIEIKQPRFDARSPGRLALRTMHMRQQRISKYCVSLAKTANLRGSGVFNPALRELERMNRA